MGVAVHDRARIGDLGLGEGAGDELIDSLPHLFCLGPPRRESQEEPLEAARLLVGGATDEAGHVVAERLEDVLGTVLVEHLGDLAAYRQRRVERLARVLEDHRDPIAADRQHLVVGDLEEVDRVSAALACLGRPEIDLTAGIDPRGAGDETNEGASGHALAAAGLADQPEGLSISDVEGDAVDCVHHSSLGLEIDLEIPDRSDQGPGGGSVICGVDVDVTLGHDHPPCGQSVAPIEVTPTSMSCDHRLAAFTSSSLCPLFRCAIDC